MPTTTSKADEGRGETINLRVSRGQKALIDRAAQALGRNRSDFMLEAACREAEGVLLDRRYFALPEEVFKRFTAMLDKPPASTPRWIHRLTVGIVTPRRSAAWPVVPPE